MGVPKFYRWISERYPLINQILTDSSVLPEIDNFYLDMNGIIHACTHPNDQDQSKTLSMRDMMLGIFRYIDRMVSEIVRPKKILFMAIDGVAPRAKLNQQRARRFRAAQDREESLLKARQRGDLIDESTLFDSNCITPGTEFMEQVGKHLRYFIRKKIKEDPLWRGLQIIFSGHDVPGEGEHKIMEFIREQRAQPNYQANQRHCMYGQDADLIMLGLASHEPHFTLLREVVQFNTRPHAPSSRQTVIRQTKEVQFQLLHVAVLREYLEVDLALGCPHEVNKERLIDDFIMLTFLVGNDFLPHLPTLDISEHAFDVIFDAYKELAVSRPGYLIEGGEIVDYERLEALFRRIGEQENKILSDREDDVKLFNNKRSKRNPLFSSSHTAMLTNEELEEIEESKQQAYEQAILEALGRSPDETTAAEKKPALSLVKDYRGRYYYEKFGLILQSSSSESQAALDELMSHYLQGLMWCIAYYIKGCISWKWYYPYHYGPMLQDMKGLASRKQQIRFDLGQPFHPYQQLLGCLPPASKRLVPLPYQYLMTDPTSPLIEFYPIEFRIDQDGKKNPWEAVVLLPFIDESKLFAAEAIYCPVNKLTADETRRNQFGKILCFAYDPNHTETYPSCNPLIQLPDIPSCQSICMEQDFRLSPGPPFQPVLVSGTQPFVAGFPSLASLPISGCSIDFLKINVFGGDSKYRSVILELEQRVIDLKSFDMKLLLGRSVYVNYPTFHEARVVAVSTRDGEFRLIKSSSLPSSTIHHAGNSIAAKIVNQYADKRSGLLPSDQIIGSIGDGSETIIYRAYDGESSRAWEVESESEMKKYLKGRGIPGTAGLNIGAVNVRLRVNVLQGMKVDVGTGARSKVFGTSEADIPLQLTGWTPLSVDLRFQETQELPIEVFMPYNCSVIGLQGKYRGLLGRVVGPHGPEKATSGGKKKLKKRLVDVEFSIPQPVVETPFGYAIAMSITDTYYSSRDVCRMVGIPPQVFGMIVASVNVEPGRLDLGLNLKRNGQYQLYEYCRRIDSTSSTHASTNVWTRVDDVHITGSVLQSHEEAIVVDQSASSITEKVLWEYSEKTVALVQAYKAKFPVLFNSLATLPSSKVYLLPQLLPATKTKSSQAMLDEIMKWLSEQAFFSMQRTPLTTSSLSLTAMKAIEKAADVRMSQIRSHEIEKVVVKDYPVDMIFRGDFLTSNDVALEFNNTHPPKLGDRVVNLTPSMAPFGLRGTVIVIHQATQYVEVSPSC
jgi:5'-3' exoribonuclease 1